MGQVGLHGLTGLILGEHLLNRFGQDELTRRALVFSFVVGNIAPDLDFIGTIMLYPINNELAVHMHRGFTHSILAALVIACSLSLIAWIMNDPYVRFLGYGMSLGMLAHFTADIFMWFTAVDVFWPLGIYGYIPPVDLWWWYTPPSWLGRVAGAFELGAFALYFEALIRLARRFGSDSTVVPVARRAARFSWIGWAFLMALAFEGTDQIFVLILYPYMALVGMPTCIYLTWRMQSTIEHLAAPGEGRHPQE